MKDKISAIVVTFNRLEWLKKNINSLLEQTHKLNKIYIVNNASTDGTFYYLEKMKMKESSLEVINLNENLGGAGGFHYGLKKAIEFNEEWLTIMDDDCVLDKDFAKNLLNENLEEKNAYVPFRYDYEDKKSLYFKKLKKVEENKYTKSRFPFNGYTVHKNLIKKIGLPLKEYFIYGDDDEYCYRVLKNGGENIAISTSILYHPNKLEGYKKIKGLTFSQADFSKLRAYYCVRNGILNYKKYREFSELNIFKLLLINLKLSLKYLIISRYDLAKLSLLGILDGLKGKEISKGLVK